MTSKCHKCGTSYSSNTLGGLCSACLLATALFDDTEESAATVAMPAIGKRFGDYQLLAEIGRGGMGVVYRAQQLSLNRTVAVKVLLLSAHADSEAYYRFSKEAEMAAALQHPGIVAIHEIGEQDGVPYITMGLIEGSNLTQLCDGRPLEATRAATFVAAIADAVQHAHDHRVFHRDLKPSNILVDRHDRPHVSDFGIAKRLDDAFEATLTGQILGSPNYLSPEQALGNTAMVGPPTDVYGLGAILYYLLTGRAPFLGSSITETFRLVIETEPVPPRLLNPDIPRDLETVCLKCLEKDYSRRYQSASELALDLRRFLHNEPVAAQPPSNTYRFIKFVRRNRLAVGSASTVALVLVAGSVVSTYQAVRATRAEHVAELERSTAVNERARAEDLLTFMLGDLRDQLARVGRLDVLEAVGNKAMAYFSSKNVQDLDDITLAHHAKALTQIGEVRMAQARYADATSAFMEAYNRASALANRHPKEGTILFERGQAEYWNGYVHWQCGELESATHWLTLYYSTCKELVALDPSRISWQSELAYGHHNLAVLRQERGEFATARADFIAELDTMEQINKSSPGDMDVRFRIADAHSWLGGLAEQQGNFEEARKEYLTQIIVLEQLAEPTRRSTRWQYRMADAWLHEAHLNIETGQFAAATSRLKDARLLLDVLVAHDPSNRRWLAASLNARLKEIMLARQRGDLLDASIQIDEARPQLEKLVAAEPTDRNFAILSAVAWRLQAELRFSTGRPGATDCISKAIESGNALLQKRRPSDADIGELASAYIVSAQIASQSSDPTLLKRDLQRALELLAPRVSGTQDCRLLDPFARATHLLGRLEESWAIVSKLRYMGYVPLTPWPASHQLMASDRSVQSVQ